MKTIITNEYEFQVFYALSRHCFLFNW